MRRIITISPSPPAAEYVEQCERLRKLNSGQLGFVPASTYHYAAERRKLLIAQEVPRTCNMVDGFLWWTRPHKGDVINIKQLCVARPLRRRGIATQLVKDLIVFARYSPVKTISLRCREDITAANCLWEKLGFFPSAIDIKKGSRGHRVVQWTKIIDGENEKKTIEKKIACQRHAF